MLLVLLSALFGAYLGLTRPGKPMAVAASGVVAVAAHVALSILAGWLLTAADDRGLARRLVAALGLDAPLWQPALAAVVAATLAAVLATVSVRRNRGVYLADTGEWRPERRRRPRGRRAQDLNDGAGRPISELLNR